MALTRIPIKIDDLKRFVAYGASLVDMGSTSPPSNFTVPEFNIVPQQKSSGWTVYIQVLNEANEGTNSAYYLGPGLHRTNLMIEDGSLTNFIAENDNKEIYRNVTARDSDLSRQAELEHCTDIVLAYTITLSEVQDAIDAAKASLKQANETFTKRDKAMKAALNALRNYPNLHQVLKDIFTRNVNVNGQVDRAGFKTELGDLYLATADKTVGRDNNLWHHFYIDKVNKSKSLASWLEYIKDKLGLENVDVRDLDASNLIADVGNHPSNAIIQL